MILKEQEMLRARLEALEAQQAVMAGFVSVLMQTALCQFPESQQAALRATYENLFERAIAQLLSSDLGFSDASIRAVEHLKTNMMSACAAHLK